MLLLAWRSYFPRQPPAELPPQAWRLRLRATHRIGPCPDKLMLPASISQKILPAMLAGIYPDFHLVDDYGLSPGSGIAVTEG